MNEFIRSTLGRRFSSKGGCRNLSEAISAEVSLPKFAAWIRHLFIKTERPEYCISRAWAVPMCILRLLGSTKRISRVWASRPLGSKMRIARRGLEGDAHESALPILDPRRHPQPKIFFKWRLHAPIRSDSSRYFSSKA